MGRLRRIRFGQFLTRLRREAAAGRVTFLVGAGVSMLPPTYLPSGPRLRDVAVRALCGMPQLRAEWRRLAALPRYRDMVPEIAFQSIDDCIGERLGPLFAMLHG
ncbi:MAG TPA: hypothetical protein VGR02_01860, partial [Thermoanaerobaculia bacterium]|nr:hypothetical protein [Thermoanaerobaculia bacterium]